MKNIINNKTAIKKGFLKGDVTVTIGSLVNTWFARVDENNKYTVLTFSTPTGTKYFKSESEFISHLEGDKTLGSFIPNPSDWTY